MTLDDAKSITTYITRPTHLPLPIIIIKDTNNFNEDIAGPTHPLPPPITSNEEKNVTKNTTNPMHPPTPLISINNVPNEQETITSVVLIPTGGPKTHNTTLISLCNDPTIVRPFWCTLQGLGFFRPMTNFIYASSLKIYNFFRFSVYHALLNLVVNDYPIWRLLIITTTVFGLAILPCHARRSLHHKWRTVDLVAKLVFSGGCFIIMTYEYQPFYKPCNEDRCIVAVGVVFLPFLHWIAPQGTFTYQWNALCEGLLGIWEIVQSYAAGIWRIIAYSNRHIVEVLGFVLLSTYGKHIIQIIESPGPAFNAIRTATGLYWDYAPKFLEAYNITESRRRIFRERTSVYGIPVLRLFAFSMIPSVYYYLLHFARQNNMYAKSLACFLPFWAIIIAGWVGFDPLDLASVTVGTLVDVTIFYLGQKWTALGHLHLAFCYLCYWVMDLTVVPLLKVVGRLFLTVAMGLWELTRRHRFIFRTFCSVFVTGVIGNVVLFGWSWWKFGPLGAKHYFDTVSAYHKVLTAIYMAILLLAWSWILSSLSWLIQFFASILSMPRDYVTSYNWSKFNISAWIQTPNATHVYDNLYSMINGSAISLLSRSPDGVNGVFDFVKLVAGSISNIISLCSKSLLHSGLKYINNFYGFVARTFGNMVKRTIELWTQNQETFNTVSRVLVWFGVLHGVWKFWRWLMGDGGGGAANGGLGSGPPGPLISPPDPQETPLPSADNENSDGGNNLQSLPSGDGQDHGNDEGSNEHDPPSPHSTSIGGGDRGDEKIEAAAPTPRLFFPPHIVPSRLSPSSSPDSSPPPSRGSTPLPRQGPPILPLPLKITGPTDPPIVGLTPSEQAAEPHRPAQAEEHRLAEIKRQKEVLPLLLHEYHRRNEAAFTIKQAYRTYRSNKTLKWWKETVVSSLAHERERFAEAARCEAERLRKEEEDHAVEAARLEAERLRKKKEDRAAETARLEAEHLRKAAAERVEAERVEFAHIERRERNFRQKQNDFNELARLNRERQDRLDELERKRLSEEKVRRENERIAAEQKELAREREELAEKASKEWERLQDVEKKRREQLAEIEMQKAANTPKKTNLAAAKERKKARDEFMKSRREEKKAALAAKENPGDGKDAQKKCEEQEAVQAALKKQKEEEAA
jgi:hypothetical protein